MSSNTPANFGTTYKTKKRTVAPPVANTNRG